MIRMSTVVRTGGRANMKDYFDVLEIFEKKRMTQEQADAYWRKLLSNSDLEQDELGLNSDFPKRIEWRETGVKEWFDEVSQHQLSARRSSEAKCGSDTAMQELAGQLGNLNCDFSHKRYAGILKDVQGIPRSMHALEDKPGPTPLKRQRASLSSGQPLAECERPGMASIATGRLLAYEEADAVLRQTAKTMATQIKAARCAAQPYDDDEVLKNDFSEYLRIVQERIALAEIAVEGVIVDIENPSSITLCGQDPDAENDVKSRLATALAGLSFAPFEQMEAVFVMICVGGVHSHGFCGVARAYRVVHDIWHALRSGKVILCCRMTQLVLGIGAYAARLCDAWLPELDAKLLTHANLRLHLHLLMRRPCCHCGRCR
jgi:hypothetical protein